MDSALSNDTKTVGIPPQLASAWPQELLGYALAQSGSGWAVYKSADTCGFHQALRFRVAVTEANGIRPCVVEHGSSSLKMKLDVPDRYLITRTEVFSSLDRALRAMRGETEIAKRKRKPVRIQEMNDAEIQAWNAAVKQAASAPRREAA